jgi:hypothetical protein
MSLRASGEMLSWMFREAMIFLPLSVFLQQLFLSRLSPFPFGVSFRLFLWQFLSSAFGFLLLFGFEPFSGAAEVSIFAITAPTSTDSPACTTS